MFKYRVTSVLIAVPDSESRSAGVTFGSSCAIESSVSTLQIGVVVRAHARSVIFWLPLPLMRFSIAKRTHPEFLADACTRTHALVGRGETWPCIIARYRTTHTVGSRGVLMQFEGNKEFPLPLETTYAKLGDAGFLISSLTAAEAVKVHGPDLAEWKLRPALSFVAGTMDSRLQVLERIPTERIRLQITNKGIGSSSTTEIRLTLANTSAGTKIHWVGEITALTGLLKMVPKGLIQSTASKIIEDIWAGVEKKLAE